MNTQGLNILTPYLKIKAVCFSLKHFQDIHWEFKLYVALGKVTSPQKSPERFLFKWQISKFNSKNQVSAGKNCINFILKYSCRNSFYLCPAPAEKASCLSFRAVTFSPGSRFQKVRKLLYSMAWTKTKSSELSATTNQLWLPSDLNHL